MRWRLRKAGTGTSGLLVGLIVGVVMISASLYMGLTVGKSVKDNTDIMTTTSSDMYKGDGTAVQNLNG